MPQSQLSTGRRLLFVGILLLFLLVFFELLLQTFDFVTVGDWLANRTGLALFEEDEHRCYRLRSDLHYVHLLEPTAELRSRVESDEEAASESIEVEARRLDELLEFPPELQPVLIKLDVQGGELRALQGATGVLDQVACVQLEYDFDLLYEGQASLLDLFGFMISQGFSRFLQIDRHMSEGKIRRCDLLFLRDVPEAAPQATS